MKIKVKGGKPGIDIGDAARERQTKWKVNKWKGKRNRREKEL